MISLNLLVRFCRTTYKLLSMIDLVRTWVLACNLSMVTTSGCLIDRLSGTPWGNSTFKRRIVFLDVHSQRQQSLIDPDNASGIASYD